MYFASSVSGTGCLACCQCCSMCCNGVLCLMPGKGMFTSDSWVCPGWRKEWKAWDSRFSRPQNTSAHFYFTFLSCCTCVGCYVNQVHYLAQISTTEVPELWAHATVLLVWLFQEKNWVIKTGLSLIKWRLVCLRAWFCNSCCCLTFVSKSLSDSFNLKQFQ